MVSLIRRTPLSSLSSPPPLLSPSAYPLSNMVLLCHWWAGAIIGSPRLRLEQNVRRFKAACQSAFCTDSRLRLPNGFSLHISPNEGAQRQRREEKCPTYKCITLTLLLPSEGPDFLCSTLSQVWHSAACESGWTRCPSVWLRDTEDANKLNACDRLNKIFSQVAVAILFLEKNLLKVREKSGYFPSNHDDMSLKGMHRCK